MMLKQGLRLVLLCTFLSGASSAIGQVTGDYRYALGGFSAGNWSALGTWERFNGTTWATPTGGQGYPGQFAFANPATNTVTYGDGFTILTLDVTPAVTIPNLVIDTGFGLLQTSGNPNLTINTLVINNILDFFTFSGTGNLTINNTATIDGFLTDDNGTGVTTFIGNVDVGGGLTTTAVTNPANLIFRGGIANTGAVDCGAATFNTNNQALTGNGDYSFANNVNVTAVLVTHSGAGDMTISGTTTLSTSGGYTDSSNAGQTIIGGNLSIGAGTTFTSTAVANTANMVFRGGIAQGGTFAAGGATFNTNNQAITGANALTFSNNVAITGVTVTNSNTSNLSILGTTTLSTSGGFTDSDNTGITTLVGNVNVGAGTSFISTGVTSFGNMVFRGGITNSGTFTAGGATFNTNNQSITGSQSLSFANNVFIGGVTLTNTNNANMTVTGITTLNTSGGFTDGNNNGVTTFIGNVDIQANTSFISTVVTNTAGMVFRGGIANNGTAFTAGGATFNTNNQSITGATAYSFANNVAITNVLLTASNTSAITITGTTTLATGGGFTDSDNTAITTLVGNVVVGTGTTFTSTAIITPANLVFRGGIANDGTFNGGAATFNTNNQALTGGAVITFANQVLVATITVTNSNTTGVTLTSTTAGALSGSGGGTWTQGNNSTLNYAAPTITVPTMNASNTGNTVNYNSTGAGQTIFNPSASTYRNLTLSGTGNQTKTLSAATIVAGNLTIQNTAIFSVSTFALSVGGNWNNTSTDADPFIQGAQTVTFNGTAAQTISNTGNANGTVFNSMTVNNTFVTRPQLTFNAAGTVNSVLTLTQGVVATTSTNLLTMPDGATTNGGDADSYVDGPLRKIGNDAFIFPSGDGAFWARIGISAPATLSTEFTAQYFAAAWGDVSTDGTFNDPSDNEYWTLIRAVNNDAVTVRLFWEDNTRSQINSPNADLIVARHNGADWINHGQSAIASAGITGSVTSNSVSTFYASPNPTPFTFGSIASGATNPLPIELVDFRAQVLEDEVQLIWETASELNNDFFTVERSTGGENFSSVGRVNGSGTTNHGRTYSLHDANPFNGTSYYRLKQTDFDGTSSYSKIIHVNFEGAPFSLYPNPTIGHEINIKVNGLHLESVPVVIYDQMGRELTRFMLPVDQNLGVASKLINFERVLPKGVYTVKVGASPLLIKRFVVAEK